MFLYETLNSSTAEVVIESLFQNSWHIKMGIASRLFSGYTSNIGGYAQTQT
jgi:hypothetical protein